MSLRRTALQTAVLETTWGSVFVDAGSRGVWACRLPAIPAPSIPFRVLRVRLPRGAYPGLRQAMAFARALLEGRVPEERPALDPSYSKGATEFRRAIWMAMHRIPRGQTVTYSELARNAGFPHAARAAGGACGANPLPLFIPCHRVVASGGRLGGFSSGVAWKSHLLRGEGVDR